MEVREKIEEVKEIKYLRYTFQRNNSIERHVKETVKKAAVAMRQTWGIGKRIFEGNFRRRMMFDSPVKSIR